MQKTAYKIFRLEGELAQAAARIARESMKISMSGYTGRTDGRLGPEPFLESLREAGRQEDLKALGFEGGGVTQVSEAMRPGGYDRHYDSLPRLVRADERLSEFNHDPGMAQASADYYLLSPVGYKGDFFRPAGTQELGEKPGEEKEINDLLESLGDKGRYGGLDRTNKKIYKICVQLPQRGVLSVSAKGTLRSAFTPKALSPENRQESSMMQNRTVFVAGGKSLQAALDYLVEEEKWSKRREILCAQTDEIFQRNLHKLDGAPAYDVVNTRCPAPKNNMVMCVDNAATGFRAEIKEWPAFPDFSQEFSLVRGLHGYTVEPRCDTLEGVEYGKRMTSVEQTRPSLENYPDLLLEPQKKSLSSPKTCSEIVLAPNQPYRPNLEDYLDLFSRAGEKSPVSLEECMHLLPEKVEGKELPLSFAKIIPEITVREDVLFLVYNRKMPAPPPGAWSFSVEEYSYLCDDEFDREAGRVPPPLPASLAEDLKTARALQGGKARKEEMSEAMQKSGDESDREDVGSSFTWGAPL